jgi:FkbM family methyltransferase
MDEGRKFSSKILNKLLTTESEWNPKVAASRAVNRILPEKWLFAMKKVYYPHLIRHGSPEEDTAIVRHLVSRGDQVIDIGASIGQYTTFLSHCVNSAGVVYSFEPLPPTFELLASNVQKLGLKNVKLFNCAVSDAEGTTVMVVPQYRWGAECYYDARMAFDNEKVPLREFQVSKRTVDSIFASQKERISFIKCDVNYHELHFVLGALETIRKFSPAMLVEVGTNPDESIANKLLTILGEEGYEGYRFDGAKLQPRIPGVRNQNWFFLNSSHLELLHGRCPHLLSI